MNANLRSEKKAFAKQVDHLLTLIVKEGRKPMKVNNQYNFDKKAAFVFTKNGKDYLNIDFNGKRHLFKV